jgi:uncharacterized protein
LHSLLLGVVAAFAALALAADPAGPPSDAPHDFLAPLVDHHQHLASPALAELWSAKLTRASPPPDVGAVITELEKSWNNEAELIKLYENDSLLIEPRSEEIIQGRVAIAERLSHLFQSSYKLVPALFHRDGVENAHAVVYLERQRGAIDTPFAEALLMLHRGPDGHWRVLALTLRVPGPVVLSAFEANDLIALLDQAGIRRAVILSGAYAFSAKDLPPSQDEYAKVRAENDWNAKQVAQFPDRLVAFCSVNPLKDYALTEIRRCAEDLRMRGVKLHFDNSGVALTNPDHLKRVRAVFFEANRLRLPLVVHLQTQTDYGAREAKIFLEEVLPEAPDVVVQIAHMAGSGPGWNDEALRVYADAVAKGDPRTKNLYFDLATVAEGQSYGRLSLLAERIREIGVQRILFGSDAAFGERPTPRQQWAMFQGYTPVSQAEISAIANNVAPYLK